MGIELHIDGRAVTVDDDRRSLLDVLRNDCGITSAKDGCAPQGQCGCCTVLVDGQARVSCVTPVRRLAGRTVTTLDGLDPAVRDRWAQAFVATGGSQCGYCTPGIICRLESVRLASGVGDTPSLDNPLAAHLCRCTGWQTIVEAYAAYGKERELDPDRAAQRASIEGRTPQRVGPDIVLGTGGFAADTAPAGSLVAVPGVGGDWVLGESIAEARERAETTPGRRTTTPAEPPIELPTGDWIRTLRTSWVEPAPLETEASWCAPGGEPATMLANGGAFGAKIDVDLGSEARRLAAEHDRPVMVLWSREDSVRYGPKRPPIAAGIRADGSGELVVARTRGVVDAIRRVAPSLVVREVDVAGPPTSSALRGGGWVEAHALISSLGEDDRCVSPEGARASAEVSGSEIVVSVDAGEPLDPVVLRSYCIGAAHMAFSLVTSERLTVVDGDVQDLTIRSFGIVRAGDTPPIRIEVAASDRPPVNASDAVFAAVASATWRSRGFAPVWPTG